MRDKAFFNFCGCCVLVAVICGCDHSKNKTEIEKDVVRTELDSEISSPVLQIGENKMSDQVLVSVNGKSFKKSEARKMAKGIAARQGVPDEMLDTYLEQAGAQIERQIVEQFVGRQLMANEATRQKIVVTDDELSQSIGKMSEQLPPNVTLEQMLQMQGMTMEGFRKEMMQGEQIRKLYEAETANVPAVTDEQIKTFYDENPDHFKTDEKASAKHILIACDSNADADAHAKAKAEADAVLKLLAEGGDFGELAKTHSSCPSKDKGGDLGSFGRGQMVPEFEEAVFSQAIGVNGPVVKTKFGYHIIQVTDRTDAGQQPLEDASEQIREHLKMMAQNEKILAFIDTLSKDADIVYAEGMAPAPNAQK